MLREEIAPRSSSPSSEKLKPSIDREEEGALEENSGFVTLECWPIELVQLVVSSRKVSWQFRIQLLRTRADQQGFVSVQNMSARGR